MAQPIVGQRQRTPDLDHSWPGATSADPQASRSHGSNVSRPTRHPTTDLTIKKRGLLSSRVGRVGSVGSCSRCREDRSPRCSPPPTGRPDVVGRGDNCSTSPRSSWSCAHAPRQRSQPASHTDTMRRRPVQAPQRRSSTRARGRLRRLRRPRASCFASQNWGVHEHVI